MPLTTLIDRLPLIVRNAPPAVLLPAYALVHGLAAAFGYALGNTHAPIETFWPAAGLLLAASIICRRRQRWVLLVAAVIGELGVGWMYATTTITAGGLGIVLYFALVHAAVCGLSAVLVERWWNNPLPASSLKLARGTGVIVLVLVAAIAIAAAGPASYFNLPYASVFQVWLASMMLGLVAVTPTLLSWWMSITGYAGVVIGSRLELLIVLLLALAATLLGFGDFPQIADFQLVYLQFPILLWAAMRFAPRHVSLIAFGVCCLMAALTSTGRGPFAPDDDGMLAAVLPLQLFMITVILSALLLAVANYERHRNERSLRDYALALAKTEDRVRRRTAADLHDGIGQEVLGVRLALIAAMRQIEDPTVRRIIDENLMTLGEITAHVRHLIEELDPPWIFELGLAEAVEWLAARFFERSRLEVELHLGANLPSLTADDRAMLFRGVRELLQNVVRHSGVLSATVTLRSTRGSIELTVAEQGCGFDNRFTIPGRLHGGFGLFSLREQLKGRGAELRIETAPGKGCRVTMIWPVEVPTASGA